MDEKILEKIMGHLSAMSISAGAISSLAQLSIKSNSIPSNVLMHMDDYLKVQESEMKELKKLLGRS